MKPMFQETQKRILSLSRKRSKPIELQQLPQIIGCSYGHAREAAESLVKKGKLEKVRVTRPGQACKRVAYQIKETP